MAWARWAGVGSSEWAIAPMTLFQAITSGTTSVVDTGFGQFFHSPQGQFRFFTAMNIASGLCQQDGIETSSSITEGIVTSLLFVFHCLQQVFDVLARIGKARACDGVNGGIEQNRVRFAMRVIDARVVETFISSQQGFGLLRALLCDRLDVVLQWP
jgi:hypothetical protein